MANLSPTQIDRLGDRLRKGPHTENDLRLLDDYGRSFSDAYKYVVGIIRERDQSPTGRSPKSTVSIVEKLRRESIRLSQMQDIAGCRVVVVNVVQQEQFVASFLADFPGASVIDRRDRPSYGYRAVHIIAEISGKPVEIQVRSSLQDMWAEVSEKSSDVLDPTIKYGGGTDSWRNFLTICSKAVADYEVFEEKYSKHVAGYEALMMTHEEIKKEGAELLEHHPPDHEVQEIQGVLEDSTRKLEHFEQLCQEMRGQLARLGDVITDRLSGAMSQLDKLEGQKE